jgi:hypothetical protein
MTSRSDAIRMVQKVYRTLLEQHDLSPDNEIVTRTLTNFVSFLKTEFEKVWAWDLPGEPMLAEAAENLPRLCGLAEVEMEKWWCRRFLAEEKLSFHSLEEFWYYENYCSLIEAELALLGAQAGGCVVLLGSGALPLTAILLARSVPQLSIRCVDRDEEACEVAFRLIERLRLSGQIQIFALTAENYGFHQGDVAICTSLLSAPGIFKVLADKSVGTFILRDVAGLFRLCYMQAPRPPEPYRMIGETSASPRTINVSRLYKLGLGQSRRGVAGKNNV